MYILVTGIAGFIGSNFIHNYLKNHPETTIIGLDNLTYAGNPDNLDEISPGRMDRFKFVQGDIGDRDLLRRILTKWPIYGIINFAAESHVDRSIQDPDIFLKTNILGTHTLLHAAKEAWYKDGRWIPEARFLQVSTDEVYGSLGAEGAFSETTPLDPHSPYSASKAGSDLIVKAYHDTFGMPVVITRCSNNYGPYQFPEKLVPLIISRTLAHQSIPVYGDGHQIRDWLHVSDHCHGIDLVFKEGRTGEVYNIGGNNEWENIAIVRLIIRHLHEMTGDPEINETLITYVADRPGHDRRYAIDATKIREELSWKPDIKFEDGIFSTIQWYMSHQKWIQQILSGEYQNPCRKLVMERI
jgi:dTDP-glucose 4,6-dehydratase